MADANDSSLTGWIARHGDELLAFLTRRLKCPDTAADVLQETYLRLHQGAGTIQNPHAFGYFAATNLMTDHWRKLAVRARFEDQEADLEALPATTPGPDETLNYQQRLTALRDALVELPESCQKIFVLSRLEGYTHAEIAAQMQLSEAMIAKHLARALRHCRDRVARY